jgi:hypothetical protein
MAFNNNVIRFFSDLGTPLKSTITIGSLPIILYPNRDGVFYFNFKEYITAFINTNNFKDTLVTDLDPNDFTTFSYEGTSYLNIAVNIEIELEDNTTDTDTKELNFIAGVEQIETYKKNVAQTVDKIILLPLYPNTNNKYYVKYFEGYPFDVSFLNKEDFVIDLVNNTNLLDFSFDAKPNLTRLFFSDGRINESITDLLPIAVGRNEISWLDKFLIVDKVEVCQGVYVKWFNNYGGYSYWLFPNYAKRDMTMRNIGELNQDFENLNNTNNQVTQIGIEAGQRLTVNSDKLNEEEFNLLKTILLSPKIYLFTGEPFSQADATDWMEVRMTSTNQTTRNTKGQSLDITLNLELPDLYTQRL